MREWRRRTSAPVKCRVVASIEALCWREITYTPFPFIKRVSHPALQAGYRLWSEFINWIDDDDDVTGTCPALTADTICGCLATSTCIHPLTSVHPGVWPFKFYSLSPLREIDTKSWSNATTSLSIYDNCTGCQSPNESHKLCLVVHSGAVGRVPAYITSVSRHHFIAVPVASRESWTLCRATDKPKIPRSSILHWCTTSVDCNSRLILKWHNTRQHSVGDWRLLFHRAYKFQIMRVVMTL